ncbi:hypothetical protein AAD054_13015 [Proteus mirabilis]|uniref:hypothetical protein n=1 Tax=Proteus mirabilis TaxID=584 RepID=UPI001A191488|nr:hypothetical protein [Proteus mirabilis]MBI6328234.1 hypothetical protein [Proteus mirabilis]MCU9562821.1 hypothetical protein [Proteus mirabilis]MDF7438016.1 hypothetical protein [Proteus mirabilis]HAT5574215.1 hypothetical protein [Proteus mirabilis]HEK1167859.1 hypothetical protein [Proteus mirabilis]
MSEGKTSVNYNFHTDVKTEMDLLKELSFMKLIIALIVDKLSPEDRALIIESIRELGNDTLDDYIKNFEKSDQ